MPLYEVLRIQDSGTTKPGPFKALGLYERADLQRLLRDDIAALADDLLVNAEEFGEWEDIDLLALDKTGRLVGAQTPR
jgi:hypothetical protein